MDIGNVAHLLSLSLKIVEWKFLELAIINDAYLDSRTNPAFGPSGRKAGNADRIVFRRHVPARLLFPSPPSL
jgi:hypothetical protein